MSQREKSIMGKKMILPVTLVIIFIVVILLLYVNFPGEDLTGVTSSIDSDGDGFNDDVDMFPYNENEWKDLDDDGIGDNSDIYINGDAGVKISITDFNCEELVTHIPDVYFKIIVSIYDDNIKGFVKIGEDQSPVYSNITEIYDPFSYDVDVYDDVFHVFVEVEAWDEESDGQIDLYGKSSSIFSASGSFYPNIKSNSSYFDDGELDSVVDEFDGWVDFTIEIIEI